MLTRLTIVFFLLIASCRSFGQADVQSKKTLPSPTPSANNIPPNDLLDVLIATNEDCSLLLNDGEKEAVSKDAFLYLKLAPGFYRFSAKSNASGDLLRDTFSVAAGKLNEVFIDMLYTMDVEKERRAKQATEVQPTTVAVQQPTSKNTTQSTNTTTATNGEKPRELPPVNALLANMIPINGGSFVMGNNKSPSADEAEHAVQLNPFLIGKYEVTQDQWQKIMGNNPSLNKGCPSCPVENVSWEDVMVFIRRINSVTNKKFRLPTEAEWEYAARLGGKAEIDKAGGAEEYIKRTAWNATDADNKPHPVGTKQPNVAGIYDLLGNVSEWCADWYGAFFYKEDYTEKNPEGPPLGKEKVVRGGNYKDFLGDRFRPSSRNKLNPKTKSGEIGFRLVLEQPPAQPGF